MNQLIFTIIALISADKASSVDQNFFYFHRANHPSIFTSTDQQASVPHLDLYSDSPNQRLQPLQVRAAEFDPFRTVLTPATDPLASQQILQLPLPSQSGFQTIYAPSHQSSAYFHNTLAGPLAVQQQPASTSENVAVQQPLPNFQSTPFTFQAIHPKVNYIVNPQHLPVPVLSTISDAQGYFEVRQPSVSGFAYSIGTKDKIVSTSSFTLGSSKHDPSFSKFKFLGQRPFENFENPYSSHLFQVKVPKQDNTLEVVETTSSPPLPIQAEEQNITQNIKENESAGNENSEKVETPKEIVSDSLPGNPVEENLENVEPEITQNPQPVIPVEENVQTELPVEVTPGALPSAPETEQNEETVEPEVIPDAQSSTPAAEENEEKIEPEVPEVIPDAQPITPAEQSEEKVEPEIIAVAQPSTPGTMESPKEISPDIQQNAPIEENAGQQVDQDEPPKEVFPDVSSQSTPAEEVAEEILQPVTESIKEANTDVEESPEFDGNTETPIAVTQPTTIPETVQETGSKIDETSTPRIYEIRIPATEEQVPAVSESKVPALDETKNSEIEQPIIPDTEVDKLPEKAADVEQELIGEMVQEIVKEMAQEIAKEEAAVLSEKAFDAGEPAQEIPSQPQLTTPGFVSVQPLTHNSGRVRGIPTPYREYQQRNVRPIGETKTVHREANAAAEESSTTTQQISTATEPLAQTESTHADDTTTTASMPTTQPDEPLANTFQPATTEISNPFTLPIAVQNEPEVPEESIEPGGLPAGLESDQYKVLQGILERVMQGSQPDETGNEGYEVEDRSYNVKSANNLQDQQDSKATKTQLPSNPRFFLIHPPPQQIETTTTTTPLPTTEVITETQPTSTEFTPLERHPIYRYGTLPSRFLPVPETNAVKLLQAERFKKLRTMRKQNVVTEKTPIVEDIVSKRVEPTKRRKQIAVMERTTEAENIIRKMVNVIRKMLEPRKRRKQVVVTEKTPIVENVISTTVEPTKRPRVRVVVKTKLRNPKNKTMPTSRR